MMIMTISEVRPRFFQHGETSSQSRSDSYFCLILVRSDSDFCLITVHRGLEKNGISEIEDGGFRGLGNLTTL